MVFYLVLPVVVARVKALKADDQLMLASLCVIAIKIEIRTDGDMAH